MEITVNEKKITVADNTTLFELKNSFKPDADILIVDGFIVTEDMVLSDKSNVAFIKRGEVPHEDELEYLLMARNSPGVHEKLKNASVAIAGLGGLGSNAAVIFARMGVGKMLLVDHDVVEPSNLNRQHYFIKHIGMKKTDALKSILNDINPYNRYETASVYVSPSNVKDIFQGYDVVLEAMDRAKNKAAFFRTAIRELSDSYIIGASGMAGLHSTLLFKEKKVGANGMIVGDFKSAACITEGLMASRVSACAAMQANNAIRYILGI